MRPIDGDALVADLNNMAEEWIAMEKHVPTEFKQYYRGKFEAVMDIMVQVNRHMPTLDLAPVVHGEWIENDTPFTRQRRCSVCGQNDNHKTAIKGKFCWYCGAKMDGGKKDD